MTTFEQDVSTLRANANGALLDQIVGYYGDASDIEPWHTLHSLLWPDLSENEETRRAQIGPAMDEHTDELRRYIRQVKQRVTQPVTYADVWEFWLRNPSLADLHTAFQDGPASLEHFPTASIVAAPRRCNFT